MDKGMVKAVDRWMREDRARLQADPTGPRCQAEKRVFIGQRALGGTFIACQKWPRRGFKTCWWHRHLDDAKGRP